MRAYNGKPAWSRHAILAERSLIVGQKIEPFGTVWNRLSRDRRKMPVGVPKYAPYGGSSSADCPRVFSSLETARLLGC